MDKIEKTIVVVAITILALVAWANIHNATKEEATEPRMEIVQADSYIEKEVEFMKLSKYKFHPSIVYKVWFTLPHVMKEELYHPDDDFIPFFGKAEGYPHLYKDVIIVIMINGLVDEEDQRVNIAVIPRESVFKIEVLGAMS